MKYTHLNEETDTEEVWDIEYRITPGCPGRFYGEPGDCYPDESAEIELEAFTSKRKNVTETIGIAEMETIEALCFEHAEMMIEPDYD